MLRDRAFLTRIAGKIYKSAIGDQRSAIDTQRHLLSPETESGQRFRFAEGRSRTTDRCFGIGLALSPPSSGRTALEPGGLRSPREGRPGATECGVWTRLSCLAFVVLASVPPNARMEIRTGGLGMTASPGRLSTPPCSGPWPPCKGDPLPRGSPFFFSPKAIGAKLPKSASVAVLGWQN
jgi:hypothetical protein